jgi:hypothetical protein
VSTATALAAKVIVVIATIGVISGATLLATQSVGDGAAVANTTSVEHMAAPPANTITHVPALPLSSGTSPSGLSTAIAPSDNTANPAPARTTPATRVAATDPTAAMTVVPTAAATPAASAANEEIDNFVRARALSASEPGRSLELVELGNQRFARGLLYEEREALAIDCLLRLGRKQEARVRGDTFLRDHSESPLAEKVRLQIADH